MRDGGGAGQPVAPQGAAAPVGALMPGIFVMHRAYPRITSNHAEGADLIAPVAA